MWTSVLFRPPESQHLQSPGTMTMQPVALSQRGAEGGGHTALCRCELNLSAPLHMAGFPVDICCECKQGRALLLLVYRSWDFGAASYARKVFTCGVFICFLNLLSLITIWLVRAPPPRVLGFFFCFFRKEMKTF